ncbi:MAG: glycosyltransferase family 4 protein [Micropruina sp.]|nr:glycosyltransferase family 4 protein [Micropruina sp.]
MPNITQGMIIHDLGPLMAPGIYGSRRYASYAAMMGHYVNNVDVVFTPSEATKLDVRRWFGVGSVHPVVAGPVLHEGQSTHEAPGDQGGADFALYVGALLPHKNVQPVIEAFGHTSTHRSAMPDRLVIVGPRYGGEVAQALSGAGPAVEHRGFVSDEELDQLYRAARVVVFPSRFEGFGLPMMEALARGTAVLASDIPALREVGGRRADYVSRPTDPQAWAEALARGHTVRPTASLMSWRECAQAVFEGLRDARPPGNGRGPLS